MEKSRDFDATEAVTKFVLDLRFEDIPAATVDWVSLLLLDTLGVAAAANGMQAGNIAKRVATQLYSAGPGAPSARLMFDGRTVSPAGAAYATATQIDNLDAHDGCNPTKGHLGVALVPALFAFADSTPALSGRDALTTLVTAYEIGARAAIALHRTVTDYHTSGAWNALAVAALGARLRKLSPEQLRAALGIAEYHGPRSQMMREIAAPSMLHDGSGWGALAGATATVLAEQDFAASPAVTVESRETASFWRDLGERWYTLEHYIKPYPICRWAHASIDGAIKLFEQHRFTAQDIAAIEIATFTEAARLSCEMPAATAEAQYSLAFPVALALDRGRIEVADVLGGAFQDPAIARLVAATAVHESDLFSQRFPDAGRWSEVTVVLKNGDRIASGPLDARGGPRSPLSKQEIIAKFRRYATPGLGKPRASQLENAILGLSEPGTDFGRVVNSVAARSMLAPPAE